MDMHNMINTIIQNFDIWIDAQGVKSRGRVKSIDNISLEGISRLRELILELAVRGKLVPQDSDEEPASELLKKIAKEKKKLINEGKLKAAKPLPDVTKEEQPFLLPKNWEWVRLGSIAQINPRNEIDHNLEVSFVPMTLVTTSHTGEHGQEERGWHEINKGFTHFADGDIGLAKITPCFENSKAVVFSNLKNGFGAGTTELHIARPYGKNIDPRYILINLKSPSYLQVGESKMTGTAGQKRVPKNFFEERPLPLPPLAEQKRIVAKVDELMILCDKLSKEKATNLKTHQDLVKTLLKTLTYAKDADELQTAWQRMAAHFDTFFCTEDSIDQLKQIILQLAVMGKLVRQIPQDEPANELLSKIKREKDKRIKAKLIGKQEKLAKISDVEKSFSIPPNWEWTRLGNISFQITDGAHHTPIYISEGVPFLSVKDVSSGLIDFSKTRFISQQQHEELTKRCNPERGDLLLTKVGTTGIPILIETDIQFSLFVSVALIKFAKEYISGRFLSLLIKSPLVKVQSKRGTEGIGNKNLVLRKIASFAIVIPPLAEQQRIVDKVDELMVLCDSLKDEITKSRKIQDFLSKTIVENTVA